MIVIPPSTKQEEFFRDLAENTWKISIRDQSEMCKQLISEHRTLVVYCDVELEPDIIEVVRLHYRYFKKTLYCFVEETDTPPKKLTA